MSGKVCVAWRAALLSMMAAVFCVLPAPEARAQASPAAVTVLSAGGGWSSVWDDETHLGRAVAVSLGAGTLRAGHLLLSGTVDTAAHTRDSGYLRTDDTTRAVFARATYFFTRDDARVRPLAGVSVGLLHASGTHITQTFVLNNGMIVRGPDEQRTWHVTRPAYDLHTGARVRLSDRFALRPEARWRSTWGGSTGGEIELPLLSIQTMLHVDVSLR
ncbi:MAG: hypothetical protein U0Q11_12465 [Vicinamibacterales bacterium]